jgi:hypothetical protein
MTTLVISVQTIGKNPMVFALELLLSATVGNLRTKICSETNWKHCMIVCYGRTLEDDTITLDKTGVPEHKRVVCLNKAPTLKVDPVVCLSNTCILGGFEPLKLTAALPWGCCTDDPHGTKQHFKNKADETALLDLLQQVRVMLRLILKSSEHAPVLTAASTVVVDADLFRLYQQKAYALLVATDRLQPITGAVARTLLEEVETNAKSIITFGDSKEELPFVALAEIDRQIAERRLFLFERDELPAIKQRTAERMAAIQAAREAGVSEVEIDLYY